MASLNSRILGGLVIGATAIAGAGVFLAPHEGEKHRAYRDPVGIWTICEGHTAGVKPGDVATRAQCAEYKRQDLEYAARVLQQCYPTAAFTHGNKVAMLSFTYNVGPGAKGVKDGVCTLKSGAQPRIRVLFNSGKNAEACNQLPLWNAQKLPGITKRRAAEREVCLS